MLSIHWPRALLAALACYRLSTLLVYDDGPFDIFARLRSVAGVYRYGENGWPESPLGRLLSCPHCVGVWIAAGMAALVLWPGVLGDAVLLVFAIAGVQSFLEEVTNASRPD